MSDFLKDRDKIVGDMTNNLEEIGVRIVRLQSGEEVLCKLFELNKDVYQLKKCAIIIPTGQPGNLGIAPWIPYSKESKTGIDIAKSQVCFVVTPCEDMLNEYNKIFGSGLITPTAPSVDDIVTPDLHLTT
jgi:hypothetical protein